MQKQDVRLPGAQKSPHSKRFAVQTQVEPRKSALTPRQPLVREDGVYSQLSQLGLVTPAFDEEYRVNRWQATNSLLMQLTVILKLYQGGRLDIDEGSESLLVHAMDLNAHLICTAGFGNYSNPGKINILYQLRSVVGKILQSHFNIAKRQHLAK